MVDDLVAVLDEMSARPPALVGASMGGITALLAVGEGRVSRAAPYTLAAPASRKARAYAAPIPRLAPVTKTVAPRTFMFDPS
jgi:pimeloyl-ACP methyl ester carboxylesterase